MLRRSNLVVLCLSKNTEFPKLIIKVSHESCNSCLDCAEVMVVKFLSFRSFCTKECSACVDKVFSLVINIFIYKEVFLLRTYCCCNSRNICLPRRLRTLQASVLILSIERRRGVFLSRTSPVYEQNAVGM